MEQEPGYSPSHPANQPPGDPFNPSANSASQPQPESNSTLAAPDGLPLAEEEQGRPSIVPAERASVDTPSLNPMGNRTPIPFYRKNPLTVGFSVLLTLIYGLTTYSTDFKGPHELIVALGGFYPPAVHDGQWWRFITATLLHGNPGHLFNNVLGILIFGNLLEPVIGSRRLFVLYVLSALAGLGLSYFMLPQGMTFGASTIDYGLIGAYLALILTLRYRYNRQAFFTEFRGAVTFVLLFVGWNMLESATINLWAHIGGLLAGVAYVLWLAATAKRRALPEG